MSAGHGGDRDIVAAPGAAGAAGAAGIAVLSIFYVLIGYSIFLYQHT